MMTRRCQCGCVLAPLYRGGRGMRSCWYVVQPIKQGDKGVHHENASHVAHTWQPAPTRNHTVACFTTGQPVSGTGLLLCSLASPLEELGIDALAYQHTRVTA